MSDTEQRQEPSARIPERPSLRQRAERTAAAVVILAGANGIGPNVTTREVPEPPTYSTSQTVRDVNVTNIIPEQYAPDFSESPEAGKLVHPADVGKTVDQYESYLAQGYNLSEIKVQGNASDEDDTLNAQGEMTGGLGVHSQEDIDLANKRSTIFDALLKKEFQDRGLTVPKIDMLMPKEDELKKKQIGNLIRLAQEGGFSSILEMIEKYNHNDGSLPKGSEKIIAQLNENLGEERNVTVTYSGTDIEGHLIKHERHEKVPALWTVPIDVLNAPLNGDHGVAEKLQYTPNKKDNIYGRSQHGELNKLPRVYNEGTNQVNDHEIKRSRGGSHEFRGSMVPQRGAQRRVRPVQRPNRTIRRDR